MLTQNFRASAQSALISSIMAVSAFALVIGPDAVRYAALAALLVLAPTALLAIRMGSVVAPEIDVARLKALQISPAPTVDQVLIAAAWLGVAGAFLTGLAAAQQFVLPGGPPLQFAAVVAAASMVMGATPVIAGLIRPWPVVELNTTGVRLTSERLIRWRDIESARVRCVGLNKLEITLKPCPRDPGGPPQRVRAPLPAIIEPWVRAAAQEMIDRHLAET